MGDFVYTDVPLVVKHVADYSLETGPDGNKVNVELPGKYHVGALVDGAFVPLAVIGKARLDRKVKAAADSQTTDQAPSDQPAPQQQGSGGTAAAPVQEAPQGQ